MDGKIGINQVFKACFEIVHNEDAPMKTAQTKDQVQITNFIFTVHQMLNNKDFTILSK